MAKVYNIELKKLTKNYSLLKKIKYVLLCYGIIMFFLSLLEEFGVLDLPFYQSSSVFSSVFSLRVFLNAWVGIPYIFIEKKMKKLDTRIREIKSMYEKKPLENNRR